MKALHGKSSLSSIFLNHKDIRIQGLRACGKVDFSGFVTDETAGQRGPAQIREIEPEIPADVSSRAKIRAFDLFIIPPLCVMGLKIELARCAVHSAAGDGGMKKIHHTFLAELFLMIVEGCGKNLNSRDQKL
jgi:hypothetical protein